MTDDLERAVRGLREALSAKMRSNWDRDLPLAELLADRWERARLLGFGEGSSIYEQSYVYGRPIVGANVWIGPFTLLDGTGGLTIGDSSTISAGVQIYSHDTVLRTLSGGSADTARAAVQIGSRVYVGAQAVIARGVTVGDRSVIGAHSFVNRDVAPSTVVAGVPARKIGRVTFSETGGASLEYD